MYISTKLVRTLKATISLFKSDGSDSQGLYPIKLILSYNYKKSRKIIGKSHIEDWNFVSQLPIDSHDDFDNLYREIIKFKKRTNTLEFKSITSFEKAYEFIFDQDKKSSEHCFYEFADKRIKYMTEVGREGNAASYKHAINDLKKFRYTLNFSHIDRTLIHLYKTYLTQKPIYKNNNKDGKVIIRHGVKNTTIRAYIKAIRAIYNEGIIELNIQNKRPFEKAFVNVPVKVRRAKNYYFDKIAMKKLEDAELKSNYHQRAVDISLLQFYLGGLDLKDLYYTKKEYIHKDRLFTKRLKLGQRAIEFDVKIFPKTKTLINKYKSDNEYLFPWINQKGQYKTFYSNHLRELKQACEIIGLHTLPRPGSITTKVIRHSFATVGKFSHIDPDIIRELMAHERFDIDTVYKDKFPEVERDEAHLKIITFS